MFKNLFSRFLLMIISPILILQFLALYIFYERHWENVSRRLENNLLNEIKAIYSVLQIQDIGQAKEIARILGFQFRRDKLPETKQLEGEELTDLSNQLSNALQIQVKVYHIEESVSVNIKDAGYVYTISSSHKKLYSRTTLIFVLWIIISTIIVTMIAIGFMRNQIRAILELAQAAEKLGKGQEIGAFEPRGAKEIRIAGHAFLRMKRRIHRYIYHRTQLLAHISHDLRTPLTRMRLYTEFAESRDLADSLNKEIKIMEGIIEEYLNFAKEEGNELTKDIDVTKRINDIIDIYNNNKIKFESLSKKLIIKFRPNALDRIIYNLLDNALKYARSKVLIKVESHSKQWSFQIEDDGVGIDPSYYSKVFKPFFKIDNKSEGFGLGLASVKSIVYGHGGKIKLDQSKLGGLKIIIKVPK